MHFYREIMTAHVSVHRSLQFLFTSRLEVRDSAGSACVSVENQHFHRESVILLVFPGQIIFKQLYAVVSRCVRFAWYQ